MRYLTIVAWVAIVLGCVLRVNQLPTRVLFIDEAITQMRVAGQTDASMTAAFYDGKSRTAQQLRLAGAVNAASTPQRAVASLIAEDAQHPPLFYVLELAITRAFGNALLVWRVLPALFGLLAIPAAYALARELFQNGRAGLIAAGLFALSPIQRVYSDQAREYSLLTLLIVLSAFAVARAVRLSSVRWWAIYALCVALGLWASPFMLYAVAAHAVFAVTGTRERIRTAAAFCAAIAAALVLYAPWLFVMIVHRGGIVAENDWSGTRWPITRLIAKWVFNAGSTLFDLEYLNLRWAAGLAVVAVAAIAALFFSFRDAPARAKWFLAAAILVPALLLTVPDLILGEHRSSVARYGLAVFAMIPIALAYALATRPALATVVFAFALVACAAGAQHASWWDNDANVADAPIAVAVDAAARAQLVSTIPPPELKPFVRLLDDDVRISTAPDLSETQIDARDPLFVLRPSALGLRALSERTGLTFVPVPIERVRTAHEIGAAVGGGSGDAGDAPDLYRGLRR